MNQTINLTAPTSYGEMTERQVMYVAALQNSGMAEADIWRKCFIKFCGLKPLGGTDELYFFRKKKLKTSFSISLEELNYFTKKMSFTTKRYDGIKPISKFYKYTACDELMRDTIFLQYLDAENFYQAYIHTQEDIYLHKLMATLYRDPKKPYSNDLSAILQG